MLRHRAQPRARRGDAAPAADAVVPQHVVVGRCGGDKPSLAADGDGVRAAHPELGEWRLSARRARCCSARTRRTTSGCSARPTPRRIPRTRSTTTCSHGSPLSPDRTGTKCAAHHVLEIAAGGCATIRVRLSAAAHRRRRSARTSIACSPRAATRPTRSTPRSSRPALDADRTLVMRQALAGLLWSKQYYEYDVHRWLREHGVNPWDPNAPGRSATSRGSTWSRATSSRCRTSGSTRGSRPGTSRSTARRCRSSTSTSPRSRSSCCCSTRYLHPNGQIPAYEWNFSDVNPPVTAWAALWVYEREAGDPRRGRPRVPRARLPAAADELHVVGQPQGPRRPQPLPGRVPRPRQHRHLRPLGAAARRRHARAGRRHGLDGALLPVDAADRGRARARGRGVRRHRAEVRHPLRVDRDRAQPAGADTPLWDEQDGFFYDVMRMPDGTTIPLKVRSLVGLLPLCAATVFEPDVARRHPELRRAGAGVRRALRRRRSVAGAPAGSERRGPAAALAGRRDASCARSSR